MAAWLIVCFLLPAFCSAGYPLSGSWFKDFSSAAEATAAMAKFKRVGGDTVFLRGAHFLNRTAEDIKSDPEFTDCKVGKVHCVDRAVASLQSKGLRVRQLITYSYGEDYSNTMIQCSGFDERIVVGSKTYFVLTLWTEMYKASGDCTFKNGSQVAVVMTSYSGAPDPHRLLLNVTKPMNIDVYLGLPKTPYIDESQESADIMQVYYGFVYRMVEDHQSRFKNLTNMKGYYTSEELIPAYILRDEKPGDPRPANTSLPARYMVMYLRELMFLAGSADYLVLAAPMLDLTHASNTTVKNHSDGLAALYFLSGKQFLLRDGRGEGRAAYYTPEQANKTIFASDRSLWKILREKNSSVTEQTTYSDIYYASIQEFFQAFDKSGLWMMIDAYDNFSSGSYCSPLDTKGSGMDRRVQRVHKRRIDEAITAVSPYVSKITAFAWNPLFTCTEDGGRSLVDEILDTANQPIISECRFHSQANQSVVVIGYNLDGLTLKFNVSYTKYDNTEEYVLLSGYYFELDYGPKHFLPAGLQYTQLYDIPDLRLLKHAGVIIVSVPSAGQACSFEYVLQEKINPDSVVG